MIEALNMLEPYNLAGMHFNSTEYIHTLVEALKLAYADRDTYYGDPKFTQVPMKMLLSKEYAAERRKLIGPLASLDFRPGKIGDHPPQHPSQVDMVRFKIDDALMARDTTCVDAMDKDGIVFSDDAFGRVAALGDRRRYRHSADRARAELSAGAGASERTGRRQAAARDAEPDAGDAKAASRSRRLSTPGGDNQDQSLMQVLLDVIDFGMNPEAAVEAPRFQTQPPGFELRQSRHESRRSAAGRADFHLGDDGAGRARTIASARARNGRAARRR